MSEYSEFFLASSSNVVQLETLEIRHSSFSKTYYIVRNAVAGITAILETSAVVDFDYYPLRIRGVGQRNDLDYGIKVDLGDLGEILPTEVDRIAAAGTYTEKPVVVYRTYRSDDLLAPLFGPIALEVTSFSFDREGASFEARAPALNSSTTGEVYKLDRFPMLRGFL